MQARKLFLTIGDINVRLKVFRVHSNGMRVGIYGRKLNRES